MKFFSLIYQGDVHLDKDKLVIPKEVCSQLVSAEELIAKALEDAERYKEEVRKECELLKEEAKKEGFAEGLEVFNRHLIHFDKQITALQLEMQKQVLPLALKAAKKIVAEQLALKPDTIVDIVMQVLAPVVQNQRFTIYVSREDKEILEAHRPKLKEVLEHVQSLVIQERADVSSGGCIIETESGIINATIENQWRALEAAFEKYMTK
ncbi:MAG: type secretion ATPase inhibitor [Chlamydiota bacterium]|jgi:type III secretion protein L